MAENNDNLVYVKIHKQGEKIVVGVCDCDVLGCSFRDDVRKIDVKEGFYESEVLTIAEALKLLAKAPNINVVGEKIVKALLKANIVNQYNVVRIGETLFAIKLVF
jgi:hypothetical protein